MGAMRGNKCSGVRNRSSSDEMTIITKSRILMLIYLMERRYMLKNLVTIVDL